jgi:C-terminal processing protease CtpA/Prc
VEQNYAEPITGDKADDAIYDGAIPGMLQVLDPHSHFTIPRPTPACAKTSAATTTAWAW